MCDVFAELQVGR